MPEPIETLITEKSRTLIGNVMPAWVMSEEISASDLRRFLAVVGETNPIYCDEDYARQHGFKGRVVPPMLVMQFFWRMHGGESADHRTDFDWPGLTLPREYANTRNAEQEYQWLHPIYIGDRLTLQRRLKDIYVRRSRRGESVIYLVRETEIRNQDGKAVARQLATLAKLRTATVNAET